MTQPEGSQGSVTTCFVQYSCAEAKLTLMSTSVYNSLFMPQLPDQKSTF